MTSLTARRPESVPARPSPNGPADAGSSRRAGLRRQWALVALGAASALLLVVCLAGTVVDDRVLTGAPIWDKPAKFALSIAVYAVTMAWLIERMPRWRRAGTVLGAVSALMLAGELVAIVGQAVRGRTSHFDFATPLDAAVYEAMGVMVATLWCCNAALAVLLLIQRLPDRSMAWALRSGTVIALIGMALAVLMTLPTPAQQASWAQGAEATVIGAHTVGLADGGPGLPIVGWSTVGGDLRIPHFVGIHGLQAMILLELGLIALGRRLPALASPVLRTRLVLVAAAAYLAVLAVVTWQALRGQSIVHPDPATVAVTAGVAVAAAVGAVAVLRAGPVKTA